MNITFIGGGNMAAALIGGLLQKGFTAAQLSAVEIVPESRARLERDFGITTFDDIGAADLGDVLVLAVKPQQLKSVAALLAPLLHGQLVISIAAGIRAPDLSRWLGNHRNLVRTMPNTPAMVRSGITGLYALPEVSAVARQSADTILGAVGSTVWVEKESDIDTITALSGSGPAYVFYFLEAMQQAAREMGLSAEQGRQLGIDTFLGAARLAAQSPEELAVLRQRVTSKGGTTERALSIMEAAQVKHHIVQGVKGAAARAAELGDELGKQ
jgi:pyrroline-5-carboxylate reductase